MRCTTRAVDVQVHQDMRRNRLGAFPVAAHWRRFQRTIAGKCELAARRAGRTLEDHATGSVGVTVIGHAIGNDFGNRHLAAKRLVG